MSSEELLTVAHLIGALWMAGGAGTLTFVTVAGGRATDPAALGLTARVQRNTVRFGIVPGSLAAVAFGSWLASTMGYDFGGAWIGTSYVLWLAFMGIATGVVSPRARRLEQLARDASRVPAAQGGQPAHVDRLTLFAVLALDALLVAFVILMATRPGA